MWEDRKQQGLGGSLLLSAHSTGAQHKGCETPQPDDQGFRLQMLESTCSLLPSVPMISVNYTVFSLVKTGFMEGFIELSWGSKVCKVMDAEPGTASCGNSVWRPCPVPYLTRLTFWALRCGGLAFLELYPSQGSFQSTLTKTISVVVSLWGSINILNILESKIFSGALWWLARYVGAATHLSSAGTEGFLRLADESCLVLNYNGVGVGGQRDRAHQSWGYRKERRHRKVPSPHVCCRQSGALEQNLSCTPVTKAICLWAVSLLLNLHTPSPSFFSLSFLPFEF